MNKSLGIIVLFLVVFAASEVEAGYNQSSYYGQASYYSQSSYGASLPGAISTNKDVTVLGHVSKGSGSFLIDHPLDPKNKLLYHWFVEAPGADNWYDGVVTLNGNGEAQITLPSYFEALNKDFRYQLKPIGVAMPNLFVKQGVEDNAFVIGGGVAAGRVSWQVMGTRHDAYILADPIVVEVEKSGGLVDRGEYLHKGAYPEGMFTPFETFTPWVRSLFD